MFNFDLKGIGNWFKLGKKGPIIKNDGGKVSFNNPADNALINVQALDPVDLQDVITKKYYEDNSSLLPFQTGLSLFSNILYTDAIKQIGINDMPNLGLAYAVQIKVNITFDGTNPSVKIGTGTLNDRLMTLDKNDLTEGNLFYLTLSDIFTSAEAINAYVIPDASSQGDLDITVLYTQTDITPVGGVLEEQLLQNTFFNTASGISVGQIFKHSSSFTITSIEVGLGSPISTPTTGSGTLKVYDGLGGTQIGESDAIDLSLIPDSNDFVTFNFSTNLSGLLANTEYWFEFDSGQVDPLGDLYFYIKTGGSSYLDGFATDSGIATGHDLKFKVIGV